MKTYSFQHFINLENRKHLLWANRVRDITVWFCLFPTTYRLLNVYIMHHPVLEYFIIFNSPQLENIYWLVNIVHCQCPQFSFKNYVTWNIKSVA